MRVAKHRDRGNGIASFLETQCSDLGPEIDYLDRGMFAFSVWVPQSLQQNAKIVPEMRPRQLLPYVIFNSLKSSSLHGYEAVQAA
jgi:hypothetical protein